MKNLILSIFPGIGLLDAGFEICGYCVVRGPDLLWGGDIKKFHAPAGAFEGVIGGPPCQAFSSMNYVNHKKNTTNLIPEFERVVAEANPDWWLFENVIQAPEPSIPGYETQRIIMIDGEVGGNSRRKRKFVYGFRMGADDLTIILAFTVRPKRDWVAPAMASGYIRPGIKNKKRSNRLKFMGWKTYAALKHQLYAQGLERDFCVAMPFTIHGKHRVIGNGVPRAMAIAIASAIQRANS